VYDKKGKEWSNGKRLNKAKLSVCSRGLGGRCENGATGRMAQREDMTEKLLSH